jgi:4-hydroxybutyryl-CoA dehydratase/vinylacetyl-CoA-Delta-isomerase
MALDSPQAQRIQIGHSMQIEFKKELAKTLAGINSASRKEIAGDLAFYMARVFAPVRNQSDGAAPQGATHPNTR